MLINVHRTGHRLALQRPESRSPPAPGTGSEEIGPLSGVWRCDVDSATVLLHAGGPLASVHLVLYRPHRRRQWGEVSLSVRLLFFRELEN